MSTPHYTFYVVWGSAIAALNAFNDNCHGVRGRLLTEAEKQAARDDYLAMGITFDPHLELVELEVYARTDDRGRPVVIPHLRVRDDL